MARREPTKKTHPVRNQSQSKIILRENTMTLGEKVALYHHRADDLDNVRVAAFREWPRAANSRHAFVTEEARAADMKTEGGFGRKKSNAKGERFIPTGRRSASNMSLAVCVSVTDSTHELMEAAEKGDASVVRRVLKESSADMNFGHSGDYRTALLRACQYGQVDVVKELLEAGADTSIRTVKNRTLLHEACVGGHPKVLELLLDRFDDIDAVDAEGQSACHVAGFQGELECLQVLAEKGADTSLEDKNLKSPAHLAAERNHPRILSYLLSKGVDIETSDRLGRRPTHYAAIHGGLESLILFVQGNCDTLATDNAGCIPAHFAAKKDHLDCLRFLVKHGTDLAARDGSGRTLAHMAAQSGAMTCLHWLFEKGADALAKDTQGNTPAHLAASGGHAKCFNCCLQHNGSLDAINDRQDTPMDCARRAGHPQLMSKAGNNEVRCVHCADNYELVEWERGHQPSKVQKAINEKKGDMFTSPLPRKPKAQEVQRPRDARAKVTGQGSSSSSTEALPKRDLAARYFGREDHK
ncbi:ankyrin repeat, PH and SEC7 domain containing protein secG-like isoform X1 [Acanthaster planci]|uniref:Ankyrin repeat, PH and SEC7 domain containing protein secG-like isoform X1 n=1 Tax=Acanthaster planci TaxID=133434 RepID=A0A8B7YLJ2_ACAPL|nr:ankyrin repeat, PH and SEC7 domain containing protein secG-like isoform X1 [Acanthaster planci]